MNDVMAQDRFKQAVDVLFDETFVTHHGVFLNKNTSFFETLDGVTAAQASFPIGGHSASIAAQVAHTALYLEVLHRYLLKQEMGEVDWNEIWQTVNVVTPKQWSDIKSRLRAAYDQVQASMKSIDSWDDDHAVNGALAMLVHTAYHLGGVRQALCTLKS